MNKETYTNRVNEAGKKLAKMHNEGKKVTYTTAWNTVFFDVFGQHNFAKVDGVYRYMPDTIAKVKAAARGYIK